MCTNYELLSDINLHVGDKMSFSQTCTMKATLVEIAKRKRFHKTLTSV